MDEESKTLLLHYSIYFSAIILVKIVVHVIVNRSRESIKLLSNLNNTPEEIELENLKSLAVKYNNMTDFVKHAKVKRQILDLEKKIKKDKAVSFEEENDTLSGNEDSSALNNLISNIPFINKKSLKYKAILNVAVYILHFFSLIYFKSRKISISNENLDDNIISFFFKNSDTNNIEISFYWIIISTTLFFDKLTRVLF